MKTIDSSSIKTTPNWTKTVRISGMTWCVQNVSRIIFIEKIPVTEYWIFYACEFWKYNTTLRKKFIQDEFFYNLDKETFHNISIFPLKKSNTKMCIWYQEVWDLTEFCAFLCKFEVNILNYPSKVFWIKFFINSK